MKSSSQPEPIERRLPPSTPTPRLPLADLLGNGADKRRALESNITPEEHVRWVHAQDPGSSQAALTPAKKRKRARSSSPASSQQQEPSNFFPAREATATAKIGGGLNTPQADPAADLWSRYASGAEGPSIDKSAAFAHLIRDASPNSPALAGSVGGLRRWASCGVEWPHSATKRRRVSRHIEELPQHEEDEDESSDKVSKVGDLLERMKETLVKPTRLLSDAPASSSPLPERAIAMPEQSPIRQRLSPVQEQPEASPVRRSQHELPAAQEPPAVVNLPVEQASARERASKPSSDYGDDDDFDTDMLEAIDGTAKLEPEVIQPAPIAGSNRSAQVAPPLSRKTSQQTETRLSQPRKAVLKPALLNAPVRPPLSRKPSQQVETKVLQPRQFVPQPTVANGSEDEFDDDDDDLLAVDLNQITATYNSQQHRDMNAQIQVSNVLSARVPPVRDTRTPLYQAPAREIRAPPPQAPARREAVQIISDDEFDDGDDIDFEQLAAAEVAATQRYQASGHPVGLVLR